MAASPRMVVLRALNLGDLLVIVPALRALRRAFPDHEITLATHGWLAPLVEPIGAVDRLEPTQGLSPLPGPPRADVVVNLHGVAAESNPVLDALRPSRRIGHAAPGWPGPPWRPGGHERHRWCDLLVAHGIPAEPDDLLLHPPSVAPPVPGATVVHVGAGYGAKQWPVERFAAVAAQLHREGHDVVLTGSAKERPRALAVAAAAGLPSGAVLAGETGLGELTALIASARLLVSGDTGAGHLASAYRTPSVVLFGPAPIEEWGPPEREPHRALTVAELRRGDPFAAEPDPALLGVGVPDVLAAVTDVLAARPMRS
ncbi:glycosyltransferase family 9 protein [Pseudonocardia nigra]|uniref:glycosyltransferase family 9 protein n=1 Tax=Pseudonocardia nigra TaxID=1921578 RepID=UPI001C5FF107|nr:glycosyltransferase family 9 protein [Pseudonocardia nigra]